MMHILDKDLERVIAEATKLQSQVLESIIGNKADTGVGEESQVMANQTSELMTDAEKQIRIHRSEKETFSKGIASIIYEPEKGENHDVDDINQTDEKHDDEKNHSVDEIVEKSQTIMLDKMTSVKNQPKDDLDDKKAAEQTPAPERKTSDSITSKTIRKKLQNGVGAKKGSNFTVIGGQKVDLNTDKPQYLKLTLEQIQELAMKQKSGRSLKEIHLSWKIFLFSAQLKIDDEAEHYCRIHSPTRRRRVVQDKVKTGMEKLNTLKKIEKDVENGNVKERSNVRLTRSASVKVTSSSSVTAKGRNMTNGMHPQTASKTEPSKFTRQNLAKKVTFKSNLEEVKCSSTVRETEVTATQAKQRSAESLNKSTVTKRSSSVPR